jgi:hypothetical protein
MPPCTGTFGAVKTPRRVTVKATTSDKKAVYSLTVVVLPRDEALVFEHFTFTRSALENGTAAWDLDAARIYKMSIAADRAVTLDTTIDLDGKVIFQSKCSSEGPGLVSLWTLPTRKGTP